jgi:hypothetical protein
VWNGIPIADLKPTASAWNLTNAEKEVSAMMTSLFNSLFGCSHRRTTFPITPARRAGYPGSSKGTYVVCLDCGKEFGYNWKEMKVGQAVNPVVAGTATETVAVAPR